MSIPVRNQCIKKIPSVKEILAQSSAPHFSTSADRKTGRNVLPIFHPSKNSRGMPSTNACNVHRGRRDKKRDQEKHRHRLLVSSIARGQRPSREARVRRPSREVEARDRRPSREVRGRRPSRKSRGRRPSREARGWRPSREERHGAPHSRDLRPSREVRG